jgi:hypothetical protein
METSQLVTIVITAIVTILAKEIVGWFVSLGKKWSIRITMNPAVRKILSIHLIFITIDISLLLYGYFTLLSLIRNTEPVTHGSVFMILFWCWMCISMLREFRSDIDWYGKHLRATKSPGNTNIDGGKTTSLNNDTL